MEQLVYTPFKVKIKLSRMELASLMHMFGRLQYDKSPRLDERALFEYAVKKRMELTRRLVEPRQKYNLTLNACDAFMLHAIFIRVDPQDEFDRVLKGKIVNEVCRKL